MAEREGHDSAGNPGRGLQLRRLKGKRGMETSYHLLEGGTILPVASIEKTISNERRGSPVWRH